MLFLHVLHTHRCNIPWVVCTFSCLLLVFLMFFFLVSVFFYQSLAVIVFSIILPSAKDHEQQFLSKNTFVSRSKKEVMLNVVNCAKINKVHNKKLKKINSFCRKLQNWHRTSWMIFSNCECKECFITGIFIIFLFHVNSLIAT